MATLVWDNYCEDFFLFPVNLGKELHGNADFANVHSDYLDWTNCNSSRPEQHGSHLSVAECVDQDRIPNLMVRLATKQAGVEAHLKRVKQLPSECIALCGC